VRAHLAEIDELVLTAEPPGEEPEDDQPELGFD
jgi:hypothetical protein